MNDSLLEALRAAHDHVELADAMKDFALRLRDDNPEVDDGMAELVDAGKRLKLAAVDYERSLKRVLGEDYRIAYEAHLEARASVEHSKKGQEMGEKHRRRMAT